MTERAAFEVWWTGALDTEAAGIAWQAWQASTDEIKRLQAEVARLHRHILAGRSDPWPFPRKEM